MQLSFCHFEYLKKKDWRFSFFSQTKKNQNFDEFATTKKYSGKNGGNTGENYININYFWLNNAQFPYPYLHPNCWHPL
jgi:hypothetical protein